MGITLFMVAFAGGAAILLGRYYRGLQDPTSRIRVIYILIGLGTLALFGLSNFVLTLTQYPVDHVGNLLNAVFISYAVLRHQLLEINLVLRRSLAYFIAGLTFLSTYFLTALLFRSFFEPGAWYTAVAVVTGVFGALLAFLFRPVWRWTQERVERRFFPGTYEYRRFLVTFTSHMGDTLDLDALVTNMLYPITRALDSVNAYLFLRDMEGDYSTLFVHPPELAADLTGIKFRKEGLIASWLAWEGSR